VAALKATFLERRSEGKRAVAIESGTVYFRKPGRMRWEYEYPEKKLFITDGKYAWFFVPSDHTVSRTKMKESDDERVPLALLTGNAKLSRVCRRIEFAGSSAPAESATLDENHVALRCFPRAEAAFLDATIELDGSYRIVRIVVHEAGEIETEFRFTGWQDNPRLSDEMFRFVAPPGVAVLDAPASESANH
jgi:outer membrane lipoprotein carrier protein